MGTALLLFAHVMDIGIPGVGVRCLGAPLLDILTRTTRRFAPSPLLHSCRTSVKTRTGTARPPRARRHRDGLGHNAIEPAGLLRLLHVHVVLLRTLCSFCCSFGLVVSMKSLHIPLPPQLHSRLTRLHALLASNFPPYLLPSLSPSPPFPPRTLAAADNAVMLVDGGKGLEPQTRKLFEVS